MVDRRPMLPHYGLPPLPTLPCLEMKGPTPWSNWVIKGRVLAGAYPASLDDYETERILTTLLELGVNTFVCLQAEFALHTPETAWRSGQGLRPYIKDAQHILIRARETQSTRVKQDKLDFLHLPIIDGSVTSDTALSRLADDCNVRILRGERLYIHCWGGHGRTGTLVATMLARLYSLSCSSALRYTQAFHDSRKYPQGVRSPQTQVQVAQVRRLLPDPPSIRGVSYLQPTMSLTDEILRPASAPPSPMAPFPPAPTTADLADIEGKAQLPINQQRKEAIRAKQSQQDSARGAAAVQESITAAINRALISATNEPGTAAPTSSAVPGISASAADTTVQSVLTRPVTSSAADAAQRQASYVQQFMQQRQVPQSVAAGPSRRESPSALGSARATTPMPDSGVTSKLGGKLGGGHVINMTASSGAVAGDAAVHFDDVDASGLSGPLRPNKVTVTVPSSQNLGKTEPAVSSPSSSARVGGVMGYLNSKFR